MNRAMTQPMNTLSTHVLDTAHGKPAAGMALILSDAGGTVLFSGHTNNDGRCRRRMRGAIACLSPWRNIIATPA